MWVLSVLLFLYICDSGSSIELVQCNTKVSKHVPQRDPITIKLIVKEPRNPLDQVWYYAQLPGGINFARGQLQLSSASLSGRESLQLEAQMSVSSNFTTGASEVETYSISEIRSRYRMVNLYQQPDNDFFIFTWDYSSLEGEKMPTSIHLMINSNTLFGDVFYLEFDVSYTAMKYSYGLPSLLNCSPLGISLQTPNISQPVVPMKHCYDTDSIDYYDSNSITIGMKRWNQNHTSYGDLIIERNVIIVFMDYSEVYSFDSINIFGTLIIGSNFCPISDDTFITILTPSITIQRGGVLESFVGSQKVSSVQAQTTSIEKSRFVTLQFDSLYYDNWKSGDKVLISSSEGSEEHIIRQVYQGRGIELMGKLTYTHSEWDVDADTGTTVVLLSRNVQIGSPRIEENVFYLFQKSDSSLQVNCYNGTQELCWKFVFDGSQFPGTVTETGKVILTSTIIFKSAQTVSGVSFDFAFAFSSSETLTLKSYQRSDNVMSVTHGGIASVGIDFPPTAVLNSDKEIHLFIKSNNNSEMNTLNKVMMFRGETDVGMVLKIGIQYVITTAKRYGDKPVVISGSFGSTIHLQNIEINGFIMNACDIIIVTSVVRAYVESREVHLVSASNGYVEFTGTTIVAHSGIGNTFASKVVALSFSNQKEVFIKSLSIFSNVNNSYALYVSGNMRFFLLSDVMVFQSGMMSSGTHVVSSDPDFQFEGTNLNLYTEDKATTTTGSLVIWSSVHTKLSNVWMKFGYILVNSEMQVNISNFRFIEPLLYPRQGSGVYNFSDKIVSLTDGYIYTRAGLTALPATHPAMIFNNVKQMYKDPLGYEVQDKFLFKKQQRGIDINSPIYYDGEVQVMHESKRIAILGPEKLSVSGDSGPWIHDNNNDKHNRYYSVISIVPVGELFNLTDFRPAYRKAGSDAIIGWNPSCDGRICFLSGYNSETWYFPLPRFAAPLNFRLASSPSHIAYYGRSGWESDETIVILDILNITSGSIRGFDRTGSEFRVQFEINHQEGTLAVKLPVGSFIDFNLKCNEHCSSELTEQQKNRTTLPYVFLTSPVPDSVPTYEPTTAPSEIETQTPTSVPTQQPTSLPSTSVPTKQPVSSTMIPTQQPTVVVGTLTPIIVSSTSPNEGPSTEKPSDVPTSLPSDLFWLPIIIGTGVVCCILSMFGMLCYHFKKKSREASLTMESLQEIIMDELHGKIELTEIPDSNFKLRKKVGQGSFGVVYEAIDLRTNVLVAAKVVQCSSQADVEKNKIEFEIIKQLNHENIINYISLIIDGDQICIIMDYLPEGSLASLINEKGGFLPIPDVQVYTKQILLGVGYLHSNKIIHRDIKGDNILLSNGVCKLSDFGCLKTWDNTANIGAETVIGTPRWMAPEVILSGEQGYGCKADIWSVGCTVCEMISGSPPWPRFKTAWETMYQISSGVPTLPLGIDSTCESFIISILNNNASLRPNVPDLLSDPWLSKYSSSSLPFSIPLT